MNGFCKGVFRAAGTLLAAGIVLLLIGFFMGGQPYVHLGWDKGGIHLINRKIIALEKHEQTAQSVPTTTGAGRETATMPQSNTNIHSLAVEIGAATVTIQEGDAFHLEVTGTNDYTETTENGVWSIQNDASANLLKFSQVPAFVITIPHGYTFDAVDLSIGAGTLKADALHCTEASLEVGAGSMKLENFTNALSANLDVGLGTLQLEGALQGKTAVECGMGSVNLQVLSLADYGYRVDCGIGSVKIGGNRYSGIAQDTLVKNSNSQNFFDIDCGMGSVEINFK